VRADVGAAVAVVAMIELDKYPSLDAYTVQQMC
jgi:hypothetical protein